jgi:hypothetical protein
MTLLAKLIARQEGFGIPGAIPTLRNNPGDLRHSPHSQHPGGDQTAIGIGTIDTIEHGWADLERQLQIYASRSLTLQQAIFEWAPESDGNDPANYLASVLEGFATSGTPMGPNTSLSEVLTIDAV